MSCCSVKVVACFNKQTNHSPLNDALGPFPDEVIMSALDRILYYSGATKICHKLDMAAMRQSLASAPTAEATACPALCPKVSGSSVCSGTGGVAKSNSNSSLSKYASAKSTTKCKSPTVSCTPPRTSSQRSKCTIGKPVSYPRLRTPRVDFAHPVSDTRQVAGGPTIPERLKRSLSTCSIAYRHLKTKLHDCGQKWLWTRLMRSDNGCHVYEVYKNSDVERAPCKMSGAKEPVILFLVMPNGQVMPFESLSTY
ncbi:uncharacterized protein LOC115758894 [Drosophila novamexicana]|uniref:uncharacterized protein LOC115758894 n=1 Tax=Drosophila novamexicana TaxID=47314 RepID=UPI0011E60459|nr:uncharacterized protein LOC115758894 [Drosophila novamexicana]